MPRSTGQTRRNAGAPERPPSRGASGRGAAYRPARRSYDSYEDDRVAEGFAARLLGGLARHPARTAAAVILGIGAGFIMLNAVFLQHGKHPAPLFDTRPGGASLTASPAENPPPLPRSRAAAIGAETRLVRVTPVPQPRVETRAGTATVTAVQRGLARAGFYKGTVDGLYGLGTKGAIEDYQRANDLPVTGAVTEELLADIQRRAGAAAEAAPAEPPEEVRLRAVQDALNQIGYGPLPVTGASDGATADAIRRFQLDNGLSLTGQPDDQLVRKMVSIGAMQPI